MPMIGREREDETQRRLSEAMDRITALERERDCLLNEVEGLKVDVTKLEAECAGKISPLLESYVREKAEKESLMKMLKEERALREKAKEHKDDMTYKVLVSRAEQLVNDPNILKDLDTEMVKEKEAKETEKDKENDLVTELAEDAEKEKEEEKEAKETEKENETNLVTDIAEDGAKGEEKVKEAEQEAEKGKRTDEDMDEDVPLSEGIIKMSKRRKLVPNSMVKRIKNKERVLDADFESDVTKRGKKRDELGKGKEHGSSQEIVPVGVFINTRTRTRPRYPDRSG